VNDPIKRPADLDGITFKVPVRFGSENADILSAVHRVVTECVSNEDTGLHKRLTALIEIWGRSHKVTHMYVTVNGMAGQPIEVFTSMGKVGSSASVLADSVSRLTSGWLQAGAPLEKVLRHLEHMKAGQSVPWPDAECMVASVPDGIAKALRRWVQKMEAR